MKNLFKLTLLIAGFSISSIMFAQEATKKQDDKKAKPQTGTTNKDTTGKDSVKTRMAITEQGTPKKNKNKKVEAPGTTPTPQKKN